MLAELSINEFMAKLASESSPLGGGSAAALAGLLAGGVLELVINVSSANQEELCQLLKTQKAELQIINCSFKKLIDQDAEAFQQLLIVLGRQENEAEATEAVFQRAAELPLEVADECLTLLKLAKQLLDKIEPCVISDLMTSACGAHAALTGALCSTAINLTGIKIEPNRHALNRKLESLHKSAEELLTDIKQALFSQEPFVILQKNTRK